MEKYICVTCGVQFAQTKQQPPHCPICEDARQYVGHNGQEWTTIDELKQDHQNKIQELEPGIFSITSEPKFGIGQRAILIKTDDGNILWDCVPLIDEPTIKFTQEQGGIDLIAISHPHYYSSMVTWSETFGDCPIYIHEHEQKWVMDPHENIQYWSGEQKFLKEGFTLIKTGGHFDGYQVLHWRQDNDSGILFAGDQPQVCMDLDWVSFMYSYPNFIPFSEKKINQIMQALEPLQYNKLYGAFGHQNMIENAKEKVRKSAERYLYYLKE